MTKQFKTPFKAIFFIQNKIKISLLSFLGLGLIAAVKRRKWLAMGIVAIGLSMTLYSCAKGSDSVAADSSKKLFVRIVQVDKDGTKQYSKTIQAVKK